MIGPIAGNDAQAIDPIQEPLVILSVLLVRD